jgi:branched-chain amino acid transport system ATP-binding protein
LTIESLGMRFGGLAALDDVSFTMDDRSITSVIGPNGAGKTTLFNCVTGMYQPTSGRVVLAGEDITGQAAHKVSRHGVARTFQNLALFGGLTVMDNLVVGTYRQGNPDCSKARCELRACARAAPRGRGGAGSAGLPGMRDAAYVLPVNCPTGSRRRSSSPARSCKRRTSCFSTSRWRA